MTQMLWGNPWLLLILGALIVGGLGGSYVKGRSDGKAIVIAGQHKEEQIRFETLQIAQQAAAEEIARIQVVNKTVYAKATHEVVHEVQYRECVHSDDGLQLVNDALANRPAQPASESKLSGADPAG
jgi:hypothetical protein